MKPQPHSPISKMIDRACGYDPDSPTSLHQLKPSEFQRDAARNTADKVIGHIDTMYPGTWKSVPKSARTSIRNTVFNSVKHFLESLPGGDLDGNSNDKMALDYYKAIARKETPRFVPSLIFLPRTVRRELDYSRDCAHPGQYECKANALGAVFAVLPNGKLLGVKPGEFDVLEWQPIQNPPLLSQK